MPLAEEKVKRSRGRQQSFESLISPAEMGGGSGGSRCCLGDHMCASSVCGNAHKKTQKGPSVSVEFPIAFSTMSLSVVEK